MAQVDAAVVGRVIYSKEVVGHVGVGAVFVGEVSRSYHSQLPCLSQSPPSAPVGSELKVANGFACLHSPVVVESAVEYVHGSFSRIMTAVFGVFKVREMGGVVPVSAY